MPPKPKVTKPIDPKPVEDPISPIGDGRPVIFLSHDHRDSKLTEHVENLLIDASGGSLKPFRSSAKAPGAGLDFGSEWYAEIMAHIHMASDVVAILTANSINRPWILFETGYAKARLKRPVFGVVFGLSMAEAVKGPFAQFQNSPDDEDSLTKLVIQLIKRNPEAEPRELAVKRHVQQFMSDIAQIVQAEKTNIAITPARTEVADAAKLFEEIKILLGGFSDRLTKEFRVAGESEFRARVNEKVIEAIMQSSGDISTGVMVASTLFRDTLPWIYEAGTNLSKAMDEDDPIKIKRAILRLKELATRTERSGPFRYLLEGTDMGHYEMKALHRFVNSINDMMASNEERQDKPKQTATSITFNQTT
jgi:hypothetical protein